MTLTSTPMLLMGLLGATMETSEATIADVKADSGEAAPSQTGETIKPELAPEQETRQASVPSGAPSTQAPPRPAPPATREQSGKSGTATTCASTDDGLAVGVLVIPSLGINLPFGRGSDNHSVGSRLGVILGWNVTDAASLNAEFSLDVMDGNGLDFSSKPDERYLGIAFSPLSRKKLRRAIVMYGPSAGYFAHKLWTRYTSGSSVSYTNKQTDQGLSLGFNLGVFVPLGKVALGGVVNVRMYYALQTCTAWSWSGGNESCESVQGATETLGLSAALMF